MLPISPGVMSPKSSAGNKYDQCWVEKLCFVFRHISAKCHWTVVECVTVEASKHFISALQDHWVIRSVSTQRCKSFVLTTHWVLWVPVTQCSWFQLGIFLNHPDRCRDWRPSFQLCLSNCRSVKSIWVVAKTVVFAAWLLLGVTGLQRSDLPQFFNFKASW